MTRLLSAVSPYWLWALLALPAVGMLSEAVTSTDARIVHRLLHPSGEFSARFLIIALAATPLCMLLPGWRGPMWLKKNRRYFGVAAFAYALLHTALYILDVATLQKALDQLPRFDIWTGWLAFAIFIPMAATSMDAMVRALGRRWKQIQRWVYAAAILTLAHWATLHNWGGLVPALVHFAPLALLQVYRIWANFARAGA